MANYSLASFVILILAVAMTTSQTASAFRMVKCLEAVASFEKCIPKVMVPEIHNIDVRVTKECCHILEEIKENCIPAHIHRYPFDPMIGSIAPIIEKMCGHFLAPAPEPATVA